MSNEPRPPAPTAQNAGEEGRCTPGHRGAPPDPMQHQTAWAAPPAVARRPGAVPRARVRRTPPGPWAAVADRAREHGHTGPVIAVGLYAAALAAVLGPPPFTLGVRLEGRTLALTVPATAGESTARWWDLLAGALADAVPAPDGAPPVLLDPSGDGADRPAPGTLLRASTAPGGVTALWSVHPHVTDTTADLVAAALADAVEALADPGAWTGAASELVPGGRVTAPATAGLAARALEGDPSVRAAHVQAEPGPRGPRTAAYIEPAPGADPDTDALRAGLRLRLPASHVPDRWSLVRRVEPGPDGRIDPARTSAAPTPGGLRAHLGRIWAEELGVAAVGPDDDFFALGGDSLVATRVLARVRAELGADLDLGETLGLLGAGSLAEAARLLHARPRGSVPEPLPEVEHRPQDRLEPFPLTDQQQAYALGRGDTFSSGNIACHTYMEFEGRDLDPDRFRRAWARLVERHDMLRAQVDADTLTQRVDPSLGTDHAVHVDLTGAEPREAAAELERTRHRLSHRVADLAGAPLYDVVVLSLPDGRHRVCVGLDGLIADLAGTGVLYTDLARFYADPDADPEPVGVAFRDYVLAERRAVEGAAHRRSREYWDARVADLPPAPDLPLARDPSEITEPRFVPRPATVDADTWGRVRTRAAAHGVTPSGLLAACYAETLAGWSRTRRFTLNLPSFNRLPLHPDVGRAVGEFASLVLVEVDARAPEPFADLAGRLQRRIWNDLGHQHVTGISVLRDLMRLRGGFGQALMPYVFTSTTALPGDPTSLLDGRLRRVHRVAQTPQVWIDLIVEEADGVLHVNWDSLEGLFPDGLMDDMSGAFLRLVTSLAEPGAWAEPAPDPRPEEQKRRHGAMAGPDRPLPDEAAHAAFWRRARQAPDSPAVITARGTTSYGELADRAAALAHLLRDGGAAPDRPVAVVTGKGPHQVAAIHGALASGAPYLPLDPDAPAQRTADLLDRAGVTRVLTTARERDPLWARDRRVIEVDADLPPAPDGCDGPGPAAPGDLAYVLFTSGSTGIPKGVLVEHRSVLNCVRETTGALGVTPADRFLAVSAAHHDMSVYDLFGVLGAGGALVVPDADDRRDAHHWAGLVRAHRATGWVSVPAMMEMLLEAAGPGDLASLRTVVLGGDWVPPAAVRALREAAPEAAVRSIGGPTETTVWNIWHPVREEDLAGRTIPYGRAIANTRYHVLDSRLRDRPDLAVGELCCTGASLARGYDDPARTAESFVLHPGTGRRLYRTGDLGYFRRDGLIEFVGRDDFQIKVRGQRIEAGEIEAALLEHPEVAACAVVGVPHRERPGHRALAGYLVPRSGAAPDPDRVREHLAARLPAHMVPATLTPLDALPLNANGKVDRSALPDPDQGGASGGEGPRGPLEEVVAALWSELLGVPVGRDDDFFHLGGDSLLATRLIGRLREELPGSRPSLRDLFTAPTVAGSCTSLLDREDDPARLEAVARLVLEVAALDEAGIDARLGAAHDEGDIP